jgi:hypothetical protein
MITSGRNIWWKLVPKQNWLWKTWLLNVNKKWTQRRNMLHYTSEWRDNLKYLYDLRYSRRWVWRWLSSGWYKLTVLPPSSGRRSPETSVNLHQSTLRYSPADSHRKTSALTVAILTFWDRGALFSHTQKVNDSSLSCVSTFWTPEDNRKSAATTLQ